MIFSEYEKNELGEFFRSSKKNCPFCGQVTTTKLKVDSERT